MIPPVEERRIRNCYQLKKDTDIESPEIIFKCVHCDFDNFYCRYYKSNIGSALLSSYGGERFEKIIDPALTGRHDGLCDNNYSEDEYQELIKSGRV